MRIVCDTNVFLSGILFGGNCRAILRLVRDGKVDAISSPTILGELEGVLLRPRFHMRAGQVAAAMRIVRAAVRMVLIRETVGAVVDDPDDNRVLEAALAANADVIVSGDRHLLKLGSFRGIAIKSPPRFLAEFGGATDDE